MKIFESKEMYLETILLLQKKKIYVRSIDIASELGYSRASVSNAVHQLEDSGLITINEGNIFFTEQGKKEAEQVYEKHIIITNLFMEMGASQEVAEDNACRVEHVITNEMFEIIKKFHKN